MKERQSTDLHQTHGHTLLCIVAVIEVAAPEACHEGFELFIRLQLLPDIQVLAGQIPRASSLVDRDI